MLTLALIVPVLASYMIVESPALIAALALAFVKYNFWPSGTSSEVPENVVTKPGLAPTRIQPLPEYIMNAESPDFFNSKAILFCKLLEITNLPPPVLTRLIIFN